MAQISSDSMNFIPAQRFLQKQGFGTRSAAVQGKFVRKWAIWLLLVTVLALFYVWSRVQVVQIGYELTTLKRKTGELSKQISNLEMEIAQLKSPRRLEEFAKRELNMQSPVAEQIVIVKPDTE